MTAYDGECVVATMDDPEHPLGRRIRIDRADKHVRVSLELLDQIREAATLDATITDGVLRIVGVNRTVAYRIGELDDDGANAWYRAERIDEK